MVELGRIRLPVSTIDFLSWATLGSSIWVTALGLQKVHIPRFEPLFVSSSPSASQSPKLQPSLAAEQYLYRIKAEFFHRAYSKSFSVLKRSADTYVTAPTKVNRVTMQIYLALFTTAFLASVASALPTQPQPDVLVPLAEEAVAKELVKKHEEAGWLLAALPEDEAEDFNREKHLVKKDEDESGIAPKVFIVSMFTPEETIWHTLSPLRLLSHNLTLPGLSPLFPQIHCSPSYTICQVITGEGEINAATTISALALSPVFDLRKTYFLVAGIGGVNPKVATLGSVTLHRYEVQVALQQEFDPRELPANFSTGYIPQGAYLPGQYPGQIYGTEVFELNAALRDEAMALVQSANVTLNDTADAANYRAQYATAPDNVYAAGARGPSVVACDGATSDVYFSGDILSSAFENFTTLMTNGSGVYCTTAQEDNATLEALLRSSVANKTDFSRIIVMRTASDFDRPPYGKSAYENLLGGLQDSMPAIQNIVIAGLPIVQGIVNGWESKFEAGIKATNYAGDDLGTLGGSRNIGVVKRSMVPAGLKSNKRKTML